MAGWQDSLFQSLNAINAGLANSAGNHYNAILYLESAIAPINDTDPQVEIGNDGNYQLVFPSSTSQSETILVYARLRQRMTRRQSELEPQEGVNVKTAYFT